MLWAALLLEPRSDDTSTHEDELRDGLATWALQWSPRVTTVSEAVCVEVESCLRLWGGKQRLRERLSSEGAELGVEIVAWAPTALAALAFGRAGVEDGLSQPLQVGLDALPMEVLSAVEPHRPTLARLGCKTLGDLRRLPRGGVSRRFDKELLSALDQAYGLKPEVHRWQVLPETFSARLELMSRVDHAPILAFSARRLLIQMCGWLAARHAGASAFTLHWAHDCMRSKSAGLGGKLTIRTGEYTRRLEHLYRLLNENLAKTDLLAPVGELTLTADDVQALEEHSDSLLPDTVRQGESLREVLERIAARLGPENVVRPVMTEDHRLEWAQLWQPAAEKQPRETSTIDMPQPTWMLPAPLKLATKGHRPLYQGSLQLLAGPHRVEGGWWHRGEVEGAEIARHVNRDYFVALSEHAGVLYIYRERHNENIDWYLQGVFG